MSEGLGSEMAHCRFHLILSVKRSHMAWSGYKGTHLQSHMTQNMSRGRTEELGPPMHSNVGNVIRSLC